MQECCGQGTCVVGEKQCKSHQKQKAATCSGSAAGTGIIVKAIVFIVSLNNHEVLALQRRLIRAAIEMEARSKKELNAAIPKRASKRDLDCQSLKGEWEHMLIMQASI